MLAYNQADMLEYMLAACRHAYIWAGSRHAYKHAGIHKQSAGI
jgi:hypothetical protein